MTSRVAPIKRKTNIRNSLDVYLLRAENVPLKTYQDRGSYYVLVSKHALRRLTAPRLRRSTGDWWTRTLARCRHRWYELTRQSYREHLWVELGDLARGWLIAALACLLYAGITIVDYAAGGYGLFPLGPVLIALTLSAAFAGLAVIGRQR